MKISKLGALGAILAATVLVGCSGPDGDSTSITIDASTTGTVGGGSTVSLTCPSWTTPKDRDTVTGKDVCALPATILEDRNLTNDIIWLMEGRVTVGNGNDEISAAGLLPSGSAPVSVELSIQAGTQLWGLKGTFANLIITRGSKIFARGTADAPIVMSSTDDDMDGSGEWGGLILHGYGEHNKCYDSSGSFLTVSTPTVAGVCNVDAEGESGFAGGFDNTDSSGIIQYLVIAEGGFEFAVGNEINGLSMVGVGSGTTIENLQIHNNADDGVEFYGGAVSIKYLVLTSNFDDSIDWDEGWQGNLQFVIVKQDPTDGGNAIEADTTGGSGTFHSMPFLMNVTLIGGTSKDDLAVFKASSAGFVFNSIFTGMSPFAGNCADSNSASTDAGTLKIENSITDCTVSVDDGGNVELANNVSVDPALDAAYASTAGAATLGAPVDLSPFEATASLYDTKTADLEDDDDFFIEETSYIGAVEPGTAAADAWWNGWIVEGSL